MSFAQVTPMDAWRISMSTCHVSFVLLTLRGTDNTSLELVQSECNFQPDEDLESNVLEQVKKAQHLLSFTKAQPTLSTRSHRNAYLNTEKVRRHATFTFIRRKPPLDETRTLWPFWACSSMERSVCCPIQATGQCTTWVV